MVLNIDLSNFDGIWLNWLRHCVSAAGAHTQRDVIANGWNQEGLELNEPVDVSYLNIANSKKGNDWSHVWCLLFSQWLIVWLLACLYSCLIECWLINNWLIDWFILLARANMISISLKYRSINHMHSMYRIEHVDRLTEWIPTSWTC